MRIGILGTGIVGRTLAAGFADHGHDVVMGTRDVSRSLANRETDRMGNGPLADWLAAHPAVRLDTLARAAAHGEVVALATSGQAALAAVEQAGAETLAGKPLIDVTNPLDFSAGFPPTLFVKDTDSLAEQIQRAVPAALVVKAFNTVTAAVMVSPASVGGGDHSLFICGNDADAKAIVAELARGFGWQDVVDVGDITAARGTEMLLPLWLRLMGAMGTPMFNFKVVR